MHVSRILLCALLSWSCGMVPVALSGDSPAHRAVERFRRGVNLGNYLEARRGQNWGAKYSADDFVHIKSEGFDHVRLPIAWHHYTGPAPAFTLSDEIFIKVDFPAPFSPTSAWISP